MQQLFKRIFAGKELPPPGTPESEFNKFVDSAVSEFENSGFLDSVKFEPISSEFDFLEKLRENKDNLVVVKFWKRGCLPCLAMGEMFKAAEQTLLADGKRVRFFGVDTKDDACKNLARYQLVTGTPTILTFLNYKQLGDEIQQTTLAGFKAAVEARVPV